MPRIFDTADERERVRAFFAELEPSERVRLFDFFSHQVGYVENPGAVLTPMQSSGGGLDPEQADAARSGK